MRARAHGHRDKNHNEIMNALKRAGYSVADTSAAAGFVDLVVSNRWQETIILEVKRRSGDITAAALQFLGLWNGYAAVVENVNEALDVAESPKRFALTAAQKDALCALAIRTEQTQSKRVRYGVLKQCLEENK